MQYSVAVNNGRLDSIETTIGASAKLRLFSGAAPANCAAASTGTMICEIALPVDYLAAASNTQKVKAGVWSGTAAAAGVVGHFRFFDSVGTVCHVQGTAGMTGTEMILDNSNLTIGQSVIVNAAQFNAANT